MNRLAIIEGHAVWHVTEGKERVFFTAGARIDCDGSGGNPYGDPYFQPDTTLHHEGKALNPYVESFIVVPPVVCQKTRGIVLGCMARVHCLSTGKIVEAVVGDLGPGNKLGEISCHCAERLGLSGNPNTGGEDDPLMVVYELWPGVPAVVEGVAYELQPY